jgi:hypothetical protein
MGRALVLAMATLLLTSAAPSALAADGQQPTSLLLQQVNAKRAAAGVPPYVLDAKMTQGCQEHLEYKRLNPDLNEFHDQTPGRPGYTVLGHMAAQRANGGSTFSVPERPIFTAPKHRTLDLHPVPERVGLAELHEGTRSMTCLWASLYEDADLQPGRRAPADPRAYTVPADGETDAWTWERASELPSVPAFDVGFINDPGGLYVAGAHVLLYHDDLPESPLYFACRGALIGPGGRPVEAPLLNGAMLVPRTPFLPRGRYRAIATYSPTATCGALQRTSASTFVTEARTPAQQLMSIGAPYTRDARWYVDSQIDERLRIGRGTIAADFDNQHGKYTWDLSDWWAGGRPPEDLSAMFSGTFTLRMRSERVEIGPTCWGPIEARRTMTISRTSPDGPVTNVTAGPLEVTPTAGDPCAAPPVAGAPAPSSGAPGTVVRIEGTGLAKTIDVRFGGVPASHWDVDGTDVLVTVPAGAASGAVTVRTPTGTATTPSPFTVAAHDTAPPDTRIDLAPSAADEPGTAHVAFSSTEGGTFSCSLDGAPAEPCVSPLVRGGLTDGPHTLVITAVDAAGNADPTPATVAWRVGPAAAAPVPPPPTPAPVSPPVQPAPPGGVPPTPGPSTSVRPRQATLDTRAASLRRRTGRLTLGRVTVVGRSRVTASFASRVRGRRLAIGTVGRTVKARAATTIAVTLSRASRRRLRGVRRLTVKATVRVRSLTTGKTTTLRRTVVLRPR